MKTVAEHLEATGMSVERLTEDAGIERRVVKLLLAGNYTPSPSERKRLAGVLGVQVEDVEWGHAVPVQHLRGNGPQTGRAT
jgi:ribosome-binding protein aMBF1 (putative translation factor)